MIGVNKKKAGLAPLEGGYKKFRNRSSVQDVQRQNNKAAPAPRDLYTARVISLALPPEVGPSSIDYLKSKCGWVMPSEEEALKEKFDNPKRSEMYKIQKKIDRENLNKPLRLPSMTPKISLKPAITVKTDASSGTGTSSSSSGAKGKPSMKPKISMWMPPKGFTPPSTSGTGTTSSSSAGHPRSRKQLGKDFARARVKDAMAKRRRTVRRSTVRGIEAQIRRTDYIRKKSVAAGLVVAKVADRKTSIISYKSEEERAEQDRLERKIIGRRRDFNQENQDKIIEKYEADQKKIKKWREENSRPRESLPMILHADILASVLKQKLADKAKMDAKSTKSSSVSDIHEIVDDNKRGSYGYGKRGSDARRGSTDARRGSTGRPKKRQSSGHSLSLSWNIVDRHGDSISLCSSGVSSVLSFLNFQTQVEKKSITPRLSRTDSGAISPGRRSPRHSRSRQGSEDRLPRSKKTSKQKF